jgi:hypothetical protein
MFAVSARSAARIENSTGFPVGRVAPRNHAIRRISDTAE